MSSSVLAVNDVTYVVGRTLLDKVDLEFRPGELTALSGPSGSGHKRSISWLGKSI